MRRWVLIMLLLVYPLQVALAMADQCCVTTPAGVTHHAAAQATGAPVLEPALEPVVAPVLAPIFLADDGNTLAADPHCPSCMLGHIIYLPSGAAAVPGQRHESTAIGAVLPFLTSPPAVRPERPKWPARAE